MTQPIQLSPPLEITTFLDRLHQAGQRIVPGSLLWLKHPRRAGWLVAGVMIEPANLMEEQNDETKSQKP